MEENTMNDQIVPGLYEHYKGNLYTVLGTAIHTETLDLLVVYVAYGKERQLWTRPLSSFLEKVSVNGRTLPRFVRISE